MRVHGLVYTACYAHAVYYLLLPATTHTYSRAVLAVHRHGERGPADVAVQEAGGVQHRRSYPPADRGFQKRSVSAGRSRIPKKKRPRARRWIASEYHIDRGLRPGFSLGLSTSPVFLHIHSAWYAPLLVLRLWYAPLRLVVLWHRVWYAPLRTVRHHHPVLYLVQRRHT